MGKKVTMEELVAFCKRRGFIFASSEIYGGFAAVYDYGPYGVELAKNIREIWWKEMVQLHPNIVGLDSSIFMSPKVWEASGHVGGFSDPLAECKQCHTRARVDHLLEDIGVFADEKMSDEEIGTLLTRHAAKVVCPKCGQKDFSAPKSFNLLVKSNLGNFTGSMDDPAYLRGETCQGIYVNYKNVVDTARVKVPFGIAQIGKAFRNEITARQFIFRKREFEQMEMQYFVNPDQAAESYEQWRQKRWSYYVDTLGLKEENLKWHEHENLVFYASAAWDIEYNFPFGFKELEGIHNRGDYDLSTHAKHSGTKLIYRDPKTNQEYTPHVVETSVGVDRTFLAVLTDAYTIEEFEKTDNEGKKSLDSRTVLKIPKKLAPVKIAVFPLMRNKQELVSKAKEVFESLAHNYICEFDDNGNVGKRYRRQDEIGTPCCVTIDFDTLNDNTVTIRDRDTMEQERITIEDLGEYFSKYF